MIIGVPREIKPEEFRVGATPSGVAELVKRGHRVLVERGAGSGSGFSDEEYERAGAEIVDTAKEVYEKADLIIKVKEPIEPEYGLLREGQVVFTYFHLAASETLTKKLLERKIVAIAYETVQTDDGKLPLLAPMSRIAGRLAVFEGAKFLEKPFGGEGVLLPGVPGVPPAKVVVIGAGTVGRNAATVAAHLGADLYVLDINVDKLVRINEILPHNAKTLFSNEANLREVLREADIVISGVLIPGAKAPKLITRDMLGEMKPGAVFVDVAIDQGGSAETSRPTTHKDPVYVEEGVVHYCVANMPGAVPRTSTFALTNETIKYAVKLADKGWKRAVLEDRALFRGVNLCYGYVTCKPVAEAFGLEYTPLERVIDGVG